MFKVGNVFLDKKKGEKRKTRPLFRVLDSFYPKKKERRKIFRQKNYPHNNTNTRDIEDREHEDDDIDAQTTNPQEGWWWWWWWFSIVVAREEKTRVGGDIVGEDIIIIIIVGIIAIGFCRLFKKGIISPQKGGGLDFGRRRRRRRRNKTPKMRCRAMWWW